MAWQRGICHGMAAFNPPYHQQLGRPVGYSSYHLHGPPWFAGMRLCHWYTHLVYPQQRTRLSLALLPKSASNNLRKWFLSPTSQLNRGIITEGKLTDVLIIPSSWGFPTGPVRHQDYFLAPLPGKKMIYARGVSHFQTF
jgi:hypothetical protein